MGDYAFCYREENGERIVTRGFELVDDAHDRHQFQMAWHGLWYTMDKSRSQGERATTARLMDGQTLETARFTPEILVPVEMVKIKVSDILADPSYKDGIDHYMLIMQVTGNRSGY